VVGITILIDPNFKAKAIHLDPTIRSTNQLISLILNINKSLDGNQTETSQVNPQVNDSYLIGNLWQ